MWRSRPVTITESLDFLVVDKCYVSKFRVYKNGLNYYWALIDNFCPDTKYKTFKKAKTNKTIKFKYMSILIRIYIYFKLRHGFKYILTVNDGRKVRDGCTDIITGDREARFPTLKYSCNIMLLFR